MSVKSLPFGVIFLLSLTFFIYQLSPLLKSTDLLFSLNISSLSVIFSASAVLVFSCYLFVVFAALARGWQIVLPFILVSSFPSLILLPAPANIIMMIGLVLVQLTVYFSLFNKLKKYLTFEPAVLFSPSIKSLTSLILLLSTIAFFTITFQDIAKNGFQLPDSLIDAALKFTPQSNLQTDQTPQISIPPQQLQALKQNPALLKQYGLDPSVLDNLGSGKPVDSSQLIKETVKSQLNGLVKPYQNYIALLLALIFYSTFAFATWILSLFVSPLVLLTFYLLEKSGYIKFEKELREVKKMVV